MLFNSLEFGIFLGICLILHALLPLRRFGRHPRNALLLAASYVFYAAWDWRFLSLLMLSTAVDFVVGLRLASSSSARVRKRLVALSVGVNLSVLGFFKYAGFFVSSMAELLGVIGIEASPLVLNVVLPVGISFYTFQTLSYTIDVYRGRLEPTRNLLDFALFVAFFPQLVAGPIERASHMLPQIARDEPDLRSDRLWGGSWLLLWGLFKKIVIADNLAPLVDVVYSGSGSPTGPEIWFATHVFMIQIYCDFSGYTDMARGIARLFGFELMENFRLPFLAANPSDYWRRWHISLSTWLRDYLYIPLGGNRGGAARTRVNLFITMLLGGLWHGAAWNFVLWGAFQGALLVAHRRFGGGAGGPGGLAGLRRFGAWLVTFELMAFGWLLFRAESLAQIAEFCSELLAAPDWGRTALWWPTFAFLTAPLFLVQLIQARSGRMEILDGRPWFVYSIVYAIGVLLMLTLGEDGGEPFIYFQF